MKILLLEDQTIDAEQIQQALQELGYEVTHVRTSEDALNLLKNSQDELPDLCIFDITLEEQDKDGIGIDVAQAFLRKHLPVLLITNHSDESKYAERAQKIGIPWKFFMDKRTMIKNLPQFNAAIEDALDYYAPPKPDMIQYLNYAYRKIGIRSNEYDMFAYDFHKKDEILYLKADDDTTTIHLTNNRTRLYTRNLGVIGRQINSVYYNIVRIDRKYYINLEQIKRVEGDTLYFSDNSQIPLSKAGRAYLKKNGLLITVRDI